jgi:hypothetical protein
MVFLKIVQSDVREKLDKMLKIIKFFKILLLLNLTRI